MSNRDIDVLKNELLKNRIELSDTISQFMEKCNNNFTAIVEWGGGPAGTKGDEGDPGVPTKPKVPIHVWREGIEYTGETTTTEGESSINHWNEDLSDIKYQDGHLIVLRNGHVYILETVNFELVPKFMLALKTYDPGEVVDGRSAYVHFAYTNDIGTFDDFVTDQQLRGDYIETEPIATFGLNRSVSDSSEHTAANIGDKIYMGVYSDNTEESSTNPNRYTWIKVQGAAGVSGVDGPKGDKGDKGDKGEKGDGYTGHPYTIDLEGDMSTISIDVDRTRLYDGSNDYCECVVHAYYGDENVKVSEDEITINLPKGYKYNPDGYVVLSDNSPVGKIVKDERNNDVAIKFIPDETFKFPKNNILFSIHVEASIKDKDDGNTYNFVRDTVWIVKGIMSTFELEILPQYRSIKLFDDGKYYPENLLVTVYKVEDAERTVFNFKQNPTFKLLYKNYDSNDWLEYPMDENGAPIGVPTEDVSCLEFKVVRYHGTTDEEIWDYEDVWVVSDGKSIHYYHGDLGSMESMMVLTTGESFNISDESEPIYCAELRNPDGYSITFEPKFYDGSEELTVDDVNIGPNSGDLFYAEKSFERKLEKEIIDGVTKYTLTITRVPYGVDVIPMNFDIRATRITEDSDTEDVNDIVGFNVYISSLTNTYSLMPSASSFNTSTGKDGDTIGCIVFKNDTPIPINELSLNGLTLQYIVHDGGTEPKEAIDYTEPLVYGDDDDVVEDEFNAEDVAIVFILSYRGTEVVRSTVPLIKDGIDGRDGDTWQYIFCRSPKYPFSETGISNPHEWQGQHESDPDSEYLGTSEINYPADENMRWYDDHQGINSKYRYEYQSYRKWDKVKKCWGTYGEPTLYSNYSESGSGYSVLLSNPLAVIPVGSDWATEENQKNQFDSTFVYLYNNTTDISIDDNVLISLPLNDDDKIKHFSTERDLTTNAWKVNFSPVVDGHYFDFESNTQYKLPITVTYELAGNSDSDNDMDGDGTPDYFTSTINWILSPIKGLDDVEAFVDTRVVNISNQEEHTLRVGYYSISSNGGRHFVENYKDDEGNIISKYQIILTDDIGELENGVMEGATIVSDWQQVTYKFTNDNGTKRDCYVALVEISDDSDDSEFGITILDYVNVTAVADGASAMHLELTQDYIAVPCDKDGNIHEKYTEPVSSQIILYNGDIQITNDITYSFEINGETYAPDGESIVVGSAGELTISNDSLRSLVKGDTNIKCIATYNNSVFSKTLIIDLEETPYELEIEKNTLSRDVNAGKIIDTDLYVSVKYWKNGSWCYVNEGSLIATVSSNTDAHYDFKFINDLFKFKLVIKGTSLETNAIDKEIRISYYAASDVNFEKELSFETIGIINGGKDGTDGDGWQYIFCKSPIYPFVNTGISNPADWYNEKDKSHNDPTKEFIPYEQNKVWFDDHQGVDSTYKYEYQSFRRWNKVDKCWTPYSYPTLYSNYSENGSGYSVLLSNPVAIIPVGDDDWSVDESLGSTVQNQSDSTFIYFYDNINDISNSITVELPQNSDSDSDYSQIEHFSLEQDVITKIWKVIFNPIVTDKNGTNIAFDFGSNTQYKLPITIIYNTTNAEGQNKAFSTTTNWTLTPIKGLSDIEVFVDKKVVNVSTIDTHTFRVGYYLTSTNGGKTFIESSADGGSKYNIVLTSEGKNLIPGDKISKYTKVPDWSNVEYDFVDNSGININCYVVLVDNSYTIIDYTTVTSIKDGADGASAMHLELTRDNIELPASANGNSVHESYTSGMPISRMILYDGKTPIESDVTYSFSDGDSDSENDYITIDDIGDIKIIKENIKNDLDIECIATYYGISYSKILHIKLRETPYKLEIDKKVLTRNLTKNSNDTITGEIVEETITVKVKYWMNGQWKSVTSVEGNDGVVAVTNTNSDVSYKFNHINGDDKYTLTIDNSNLKNDKNFTEIKILYIENNNEITFETIGVVNNGLSGDKGDSGSAPYCTEVEILGYSLKQDASINNESDWVDSINKLGSPEPGKAIYILNKYTWSDGNTTKGITVTLAGTQGDNGKSRVLFYLGSFKTSSLTLNGSYVIGKLNDERCDYYIDVNGQAWMRIGSAEEIPGYKDGRQNNSSFWKPAETVGFLQAGAITADMINVKNLVASDVFVNNLKVTDANISGKLTAEKIDATNLTVDAANIIGTLTIGSGSENEGISLNGTLSSDNIGDGVITATKIQDGAIITGKIAAGAITADKIAAGAITADKIDTSELSAAQINTTPKSSDAIGRISILNNDIKVYSNSEEKIVLQITGDAFGDMSGIPSVTNGSLNISAYDTGSCIVFADTRRTAKIGTFTVPNTGYNYKLNLTKNLSGTVIITSKVRSGTYTGVYSAHADLYVVKKGSNCPEFTGSCGVWFTPLTITGSTTDTEITKPTTAGLYTTSTLAAGEYDLYIRHTLKTWEPWKNNTGNSNILCKVEYSSQTLTFTLTPDVNDVQESLTCIASNGLRFVKSATEYFELNGNGDLTYKCNSGKYVFTINNSGLRMKCGDTDTPQLAISHTGIEICQKTSSGKTNGLKLDSLGYYMYIDGVKYKVTRNSSGYIVLTTT